MTDVDDPIAVFLASGAVDAGPSESDWVEDFLDFLDSAPRYPWITEAVELDYRLSLPRSCVYAWVWSNYPEMVKIGYTTRGAGRWAKQKLACPTDYPGALLPDLGERVFIAALQSDKPRVVEQMAHELLAPHRKGGEWFHVSPERVIEVLRDLAELTRKYA